MIICNGLWGDYFDEETTAGADDFGGLLYDYGFEETVVVDESGCPWDDFDLWWCDYCDNLNIAMDDLDLE